MKQYFFHTLKLIVIAMGILALAGCQSDDTPTEANQTQAFKFLPVNQHDVASNHHLSQLLKAIGHQEPKTSGKTKYKATKGLVVAVNHGIYLEKGDYHSYTFPVASNKAGTVQNLLFSLTEAGGYKALLMSYKLTQQERESLKSGLGANLQDPGKVDWEELDLSYSDLFSKTNPGDEDLGNGTYYNPTLNYCYKEVTIVSKATDWDITSEKQVECPKEKVSEISSDPGGYGGGGGGSGSGNSGTGSSGTGGSTGDGGNQSGDPYGNLGNIGGADGPGDTTTVLLPPDELHYDRFTWTLTEEELQYLNTHPLQYDLVKAYLKDNGFSDAAFNYAKAQVALETLTDPKKIKLNPKNGKLNNRDDQEYTHFGTDGEFGVYQLKDGSRVMYSSSPLKLNADGRLVKDGNNQDVGDYYYIKPAGETFWANYWLKDPISLSAELKKTALLSGKALAKAIGAYVLPVEDVKILITGTNFDGQQVSRLQTAGFMIVGIVPGGKLLKPLSKGTGKVWKVVIKNGDQVFSRTIRELAQETIQHFDNYVEGASDLLQEALRKGDILDDEIIIEVGQEIADLSAKKGRKLTWEEVKVLFKRGQLFNKKAEGVYEFNEITLKNGKRLDSYIPGQEIISRKATTLTDIKPETFKSYLQEIINKYPKGTEINAPKFGNEFLNKTLSGDYYLEIPLSNKTFFENSTTFQQVLTQFNVDNNVLVRIKYLAE